MSDEEETKPTTLLDIFAAIATLVLVPAFFVIVIAAFLAVKR